jgi:hypothetical protein
MLAGTGLSTSLIGGQILIYSGTPPNTADDAVGSVGTNILLCTITAGGAGTPITMGTPSAAVVAKTSTESWLGTNVATGVASFYRHQLQSDTGTADGAALRVQGTIAVNGADLNLTSTSLSTGAVQTVDYYSISFPTA